MQNLALVALGGALGASLRYIAGLAGQQLAGAAAPWVTLLVNATGSLAIGFAFFWLQGRPEMSPQVGLFIMTGILGGYTTFSTFSLEAILLWQRGAQGQSIAYVLASVGLSLAGLLAGMWLARLKWG